MCFWLFCYELGCVCVLNGHGFHVVICVLHYDIFCVSFDDVKRGNKCCTQVPKDGGDTFLGSVQASLMVI